MYGSLTDAKESSNAVIADGKVIALKFQDPASPSDSSFGVIAYDSETKKLNYYHLASMAELAVAHPLGASAIASKIPFFMSKMGCYAPSSLAPMVKKSLTQQQHYDETIHDQTSQSDTQKQSGLRLIAGGHLGRYCFINHPRLHV